MSKKVLLYTLCLVMFSLLFLPGLAAPVNADGTDGTVRLHYIRSDRDYDGWGLHLWGNGYIGPAVDWGNAAPYTGIDDYGVYWDIDYKNGTNDLNFIIHKGDAKDPDGDRKYPDPDKTKVVYCISGSSNFYYSLDDALKAAGIEKQNIPALADGYVRVHYSRFDGQYAGWGLHIWGDGYAGPAIEWGNAAPITGFDSFGAFWDIAYKGTGILNFIIHKGDEKDTPNDNEFKDAGKQREIWLAASDATVYPSRMAAVKTMSNKLDSAIITSSKTIELRFRAAIKEPIRIKDGNRVVPLAELNTEKAPFYVVTLRDDLDLTKTYTVECGKLSAQTLLVPTVIDEKFTYTGDLGAIYTKKSTTFKLWAPLANNVKLLIYNTAQATKADTTLEMKKGDKGVWSVVVKGDQKGKLYQYAVTNGTVTKIVLDPYAKSMAGFDLNGQDKVGKGAVVDLTSTNPTGWNKDTYVKVKDQEDVIIYEISVRDFTSAENSGVSPEKRGTYLGFIEKIPYLKELGVTHVQLMPVQNFYFGNEYDRSFENRGSAGEAKYNWGYDPHNYNTPEGWFSLNPDDPHARIKELKEMVKALHAAGIGVILDVVYNHTAKADILEDIVPNYYYRRNDKGNLTSASGCGNDTASERAMWRKFMVESTKYWVQEYHIDGFRFDLMGLHDKTTVAQIAKTLRAIDPSVVLLGEGWNMGGTLPENDRYVKAGNNTNHALAEMEHAPAVFNDGMRDAIKHEYYASPITEGAFMQAAKTNKEGLIRSGIIAGLIDYKSTMPVDEGFYHRYADDPEETVNYSDCHDGYTIWDKILGSTPNYTEAERIRMNNMVATMIFTSQGKVFMHGGAEMLRSKPDPDSSTAYDANSFDSGDLVNQFDWSRTIKYADEFKFFQGLIAMRKAHEAFRMETGAEVQNGLTFIEENIDYLLGFKLVEQDSTDSWKEIIVIFNANKEAKKVPISGVTANWQVVVDAMHAGVTPLTQTDVVVGDGYVTVPAISAIVIHQ